MFQCGVDEPMSPARTLRTALPAFSFGDSGLPPTSLHNILLTRPNEIQCNHLKRSYLPNSEVPQPAKSLRPQLLLRTVRHASASKVLDRMTESILLEPVASIVRNYSESPDLATFRPVFTEAEKVVEAQGPDGLILCCTAINRRIPERTFLQPLPPAFPSTFSGPEMPITMLTSIRKTSLLPRKSSYSNS